MDIMGMALQEYLNGKYTEDIVTYSSLEQQDVLPLPYLFREYDAMPMLEQQALQLCYGKVLDVGCGAGNHSLYLQENGLEVTGLDSSAGAIAVCQQRGLQSTIHSNYLDYSNGGFDTILLLMNGIGLAENLIQLPAFLDHCKTLLAPGGQVLLDSSDIIYMFEQDQDNGYWVPGHLAYYGEVQFQMEYKGNKGPVFDWLYLDFNTLERYASEKDFSCELICEGPHYDYLAKLKMTT